LVKKRVIHVIYQISYSRDRQKTGKIETMTKKGSSTNPAPSLRPWLRVAYKYLLFRSVGTTSGPRATSGPRRVAKWPAMSNRKKRLFRTVTDIKAAVEYTTLLTRECKTKTNVVGFFYLSNHVSAFKIKPKLFQQPACSGNLIHFNTFHAVVAAINEDIDTQSLEALDHSFNCDFQEYEQCRQQV